MRSELKRILDEEARETRFRIASCGSLEALEAVQLIIGLGVLDFTEEVERQRKKLRRSSVSRKPRKNRGGRNRVEKMLAKDEEWNLGKEDEA